jgi:hypothetical protein
MAEPEVLERIVARRAELDALEEEPAKRLEEVRAEREELAVPERVFRRMREQLDQDQEQEAERGEVRPGQVGGRAVLLVPHRAENVGQEAPHRAGVPARRGYRRATPCACLGQQRIHRRRTGRERRPTAPRICYA